MTLTDLSYYFRKYLPVALIFLIIFLILYYAFRLFIIYLTLQKPPTIFIKPDLGTNIKRPKINDLIKNTSFTYSIDTVEGTPMTATAAARVYSIPPTTSRFGYREKIYLMAKTLGIDTDKINYELEGENNAVFRDDNQEVKIDITNFNFSYNYFYENKPELFENTTIPPDKDIENKAIDVLTKLDRYPEELAKGKINKVYYKYNPDDKEMIPSTVNEANVVGVDFYRPNIDSFPIVTSRYNKSQNNILMVFNSEGPTILSAQVKFYEKSDSLFGIYPIKKGDQAWAELASGSAMIIKAPEEKSNIVINKMFMGYFDPDFYQEHLTPVYVFLGENEDFVAYVPAVTSEYLEK